MAGSEININDSYVIVSGLFRYSPESPDNRLSQHFDNWHVRINKGNYQATFDHFRSTYYDSYLNNQFPEIKYPDKLAGSINPSFLNHLTLKECLREPWEDFSLRVSEGKSLSFKISFADVYLFPSGIGIFSVKLELQPSSSVTLTDLSDFTGRIRYLSTVVTRNDETISLKSFFDSYLLKHVNVTEDWSRYNPQLKTYLIIDLKDRLAENDLDCLLFDLGNASHLGSAQGKGEMAPSESFFKKQLSENKISAFRNWSALSLFDTFTRVSLNYPDPFRSWENEMFNIYIHCLHIKFHLYLANTELGKLSVITGKTGELRDKFVEFVNEYYLSHISYKWLANTVHEKISFALDIRGELEKLEAKISRINVYFEEKRGKRLNRLLLAIAIIAASAILLKDWSLKNVIDYLYEAVSYWMGLIRNG